MSELKAYSVTDRYADYGAVIVFAGGPSEAKSIGLGDDILCEADWVDLRCRRLPEADKYIPEFGRCRLSGYSDKEIRVMWELGWYQIEGSMNECRECGRHEWEGFEPSILNYDEDDIYVERGICNDCLTAKQALEQGK